MGGSKNISIVICICDKKEPHIENIQKMEVYDQHTIMAYINQVTRRLHKCSVLLELCLVSWR